MSDLTIDGAIAKIEQMLTKIGEEGQSIMQGEAPRGKTGELQKSIHYEIGANSVFIGTDLEYAKYVEYGRGVVRPVNKEALFWEDLSHPVAKAKPAKANDFVGRTSRILRQYISLL